MSVSFKKQLKQNLLAIISLTVAITALGYNSWRNEHSEENRNYRAAGFEIMREAAHLQYVIDTATYASDKQKTIPIDGWVSVNLMVSLSELMMPEIQQRASHLKNVWSEDFSSLTENESANERISEANKQLLVEVKKHLLALD